MISKIYLATSSPRRIEIVNTLKLPFEIIEPEKVIEEFHDNPIKTVLNNSLKKAKSVLSKINSDDIIFSLDTIVELDNKIMGKPRNIEEAKKFLHMLKDKTHRVITGITILVDNGNKIYQDIEITKVKFKNLSSEEIDLYVKLENVMDKAGAYAIQGIGSFFISKIEGDFWNVMGFPLSRIYDLFKSIGINILHYMEKNLKK